MRTPARTPGRWLLLLVLWMPVTWAEDVVVAVATNFLAPMQTLGPQFTIATGHAITISSGSTAKLYQQIVHGAPFDVFLAADQLHPERLVREGKAEAGTSFTFARGRLVLWAGGKPVEGGADSVLRDPRWRRIAIANPAVAPYGSAAIEVFRSYQLVDDVTPRLVYGESIAQAHAMVATGAAPLGVLSSSQVHAADPSTWIAIDESLHSPILQDAVLLKHGAQKKSARAFMEFLRSDAARSIIRSSGYDVDG